MNGRTFSPNPHNRGKSHHHHSSRYDIVNCKHDQVKTANNKHIQITTFHLFTTDRSILREKKKKKKKKT